MKLITSFTKFSFYIIIALFYACSSSNNNIPDLPDDKVDDSNKVKYEIIYSGNTNTGGTIPVDNNKYLYNDTVTVLGFGTLFKVNHYFSLWNTKADGTGVNYNSGDVFSMPKKNIYLYAKWVENNKYSISYFGNLNNRGTPLIDNNLYYEGDAAIVLEKNDLEKDTFVFYAWNTEDDGTGLTYYPGDSITIENKNINLYAIWLNTTTYRISLGNTSNSTGVWNIYAGQTTAHSTLSNLKDIDDIASGISISISSNFTGKSLSYGMDTGDNLGLYPDTHIKSGLRMYDQNFPVGTISINNLNNSNKYNIIVFGSVNSAFAHTEDKRISVYRIGEIQKELNFYMNINNTVLFENISPSANVIELDVIPKDANWGFAYINVIELVEVEY